MSYISAQISEDRKTIKIWERNEIGRRVCNHVPTPMYFYVEDNNGKHTSIYGKKLKRCDFNYYGEFYNTKKDLMERRIKLYESDIQPEYKVLSDLYFGTDVRPLHITYYDIEVDYNPTDGYSMPSNPYAPINAISLYHWHSKKSIVFVVPPKIPNYDHVRLAKLRETCTIIICNDEKELLSKFMEEIEDTDIISGWNSFGFDDPYVYERLKLVFGQYMANKLSFDGAKPPFYKEVINKFKVAQNKLILSGRISMDYMELFKKFQPAERDSYTLDAVAEEELDGLRKLEYDGSLYALYNEEFTTFLEYNVRDTEILKGFEEKFGYMQLAIEMSHMNTAQIGDVTGTVKQTEMAIINYCHNTLNRIVPDGVDHGEGGGKFEGAFVVPTTVGMHEYVGTIDVTSLYPSTMRTINISPEMIVGQFHDMHLAYKHIKDRNNQELTILYENEMSETRTAKDWADYLKQNKWSLSGAGTVFSQESIGIIPAILSQWFSQRKEFKNKMKEIENKLKTLEKGTDEYKKFEERMKYFDRIQNIKKLSLNSLYGATGNRFFKFFDIRLAESTTKSGQEVLFHMLRTVGEKIDGKYEYPNSAIVAGDTDSNFFKTYGSNIDEAIIIGKYIQKSINNSFPEFITNSFFVIPEHSKYLGVEFETLTRRGIFVGRKNYILHLGYKDGKLVDDFKITGLQIKKTNIPKPIRKNLTDFMKEFIRKNDWKSMGQTIVNYRDSIKKGNLAEVGLPKGIKGYEDYATLQDTSAQKVKMPGHVRASYLWNKLLIENNDKDSPAISSGMKLKIYYFIKPYNDYKAIALPADMKKMPKWFVDKFSDIIDREAQVERLIDKPLTNILKAINEELPTKLSLFLEEEFEY